MGLAGEHRFRGDKDSGARAISDSREEMCRCACVCQRFAVRAVLGQQRYVQPGTNVVCAHDLASAGDDDAQRVGVRRYLDVPLSSRRTMCSSSRALERRVIRGRARRRTSSRASGSNSHSDGIRCGRRASNERVRKASRLDKAQGPAGWGPEGL